MKLDTSLSQTAQRILPADIVVTRSASAMSKGIQIGTCTIVSHAILMVDGMTGIEAIGSGVQRRELFKILSDCESAFLLRHCKITHVQALQVIKFVQGQLGKKYDSLGAVRSAASSGCDGLWRFTAVGQAIIVADTSVKKLQGGNDSAFYCSELVARAFELAGARLSNFGAHAVSPGAILESDALKLIRVLK